MPSEYDFLLPYSGPLRRAGTLMVAGGAFLGGMICAGLVVAFTMKTPDDDKGVTTAAAVQWPSPAPAAALTGLTQAKAAPVDTAPAATPRAAAHQDESKPIAPPAAESRQTVGLSGPKPVEPAPVASTTSSEPSAGEIPVPEQRPRVATTEPEAKPDRPRKRINRARTARSHARAERRRGDERHGVREFVDQYGVRHVILPRRSRSDERAMAYERPAGMIVRPAPGGFFSPYSRY